MVVLTRLTTKFSLYIILNIIFIVVTVNCCAPLATGHEVPQYCRTISMHKPHEWHFPFFSHSSVGSLTAFSHCMFVTGIFCVPDTFSLLKAESQSSDLHCQLEQMSEHKRSTGCSHWHFVWIISQWIQATRCVCLAFTKRCVSGNVRV